MASAKQENPQINPPSELPAILIAVSDGFGGYGDFLFALKLVEQLRTYYKKKGAPIPPIHLVTQATGKEKIATLEGDKEFNVTVLTPDQLAAKVTAKELQVGALIEGPVFQSHLIDSIDKALANANTNKRIPLLMIPEYGYNSASTRQNINEYCTYRKTKLSNLVYADILYSGFQQAQEECGILLSDALLNPTPPAELFTVLEAKLRLALLSGDKDAALYQEQTDLSMQYSHDTHRNFGSNFIPADHYLRAHRAFCKGSAKNQDVVMVGKSLEHKRDALVAIEDRLIVDGFARVVFYNKDTETEEVLHDSGNPGKVYRVIYTSGLPHPSMVALTALSGPLLGATGDQSLGEALSANKIMVYECLSHKRTLISNYDMAMAEQCKDAEFIKTMGLLRTASSDDDFEVLGDLLRKPTIQAQMKEANQGVLKQFDLIGQIVKVNEEWPSKHRKQLYELLKGHQELQALEKIHKYQGHLDVYDEYHGKSLLLHAQELNPQSVFCAYFEVIDFLNAGKATEALQVLERSPSLLESDECLKRFMACPGANNPNFLYRIRGRIVALLNAEREGEALKLMLAYPNQFTEKDVYEGKSLSEYAKEKYLFSNFDRGCIAARIVMLLKEDKVDQAFALFKESEPLVKDTTMHEHQPLLRYILTFDKKHDFLTYCLGSMVQNKDRLWEYATRAELLKQFSSTLVGSRQQEALLDALRGLLVNLLNQGADIDVLELLSAYPNHLSVDDSYQGKTLLEHAQAIPNSGFVALYTAQQVVTCLKAGEVDKAFSLFKASSAINGATAYEGSMLLHYILTFDKEHEFLMHSLSALTQHCLTTKNYSIAARIINVLIPFSNVLKTSKHEKELFLILRGFMVGLLKAGKQQDALTLMLAYPEQLKAEDEYEGQTLLEYAKANQPEGVFSVHYTVTQIVALLEKGEVEQAFALFKASEPLITGTTRHENKMLLHHILKWDKKQEFAKHCLVSVICFCADSGDYSMEREIMALLKEHSFNLEPLFDEPRLLERFSSFSWGRPFADLFRRNVLTKIKNWLKEGQDERVIAFIKKVPHIVDVYTNVPGDDNPNAELSLITYAVKKQNRAFLNYFLINELEKSFKNWDSLRAERLFARFGSLINLDTPKDNGSVRGWLNKVGGAFNDLCFAFDFLHLLKSGKAQINEVAAVYNSQQWAMANTFVTDINANGEEVSQLMTEHFQQYVSASDYARIMSLRRFKNYFGHYRLDNRQKAELAYHISNESTPLKAIASLPYVEYLVTQYKPASGSGREKMHQSLMGAIALFHKQTELCTNEALLGLLLLIQKNIASEYRFFSPDKGRFLGSRLYSDCKYLFNEISTEVGSRSVSELTAEDEQQYFHALQKALSQSPESTVTPAVKDYLAASLGRFIPLVEHSSEKIMKQLATAMDEVVNQEKVVPKIEVPYSKELEILEGNVDVNNDPSIIKTAKGFYKLDKVIGTGGWGTVSSASYFSLQEGVVVKSGPVAIKHMGEAHKKSLDNEYRCFQQAYPDKQFERVDKESRAYLVMPLFTGDALDDYLMTHPDLGAEERRVMALALLQNLAQIHAKGVTHHDVKPKNTRFDPLTKTMHILDFGCAELAGNPMKYEGINTAKYAIEYMPSEYLNGTKAATTNDIYSMTLSVAEILGVDKNQVVQERMENALVGIADEAFKQRLRSAFAHYKTLDAALFSGVISGYHGSPCFEQFITNYVNGAYNFVPYTEQLGVATIKLLDSMQSSDLSKRPSLEQCIASLEAGAEEKLEEEVDRAISVSK